MEPTAVPGLMQELIVRFLSAVAAATTVLVAADLAWSRFSWRRDLRMSRQEVKDELKQTEGDPLIKMRLRSLQRDRSRKRMMAAVPRATLVVANPTHYSVALRYVREEGGAPLVLAKGKDLIALKIRFIAEHNGIPIYEDKALARSLYDKVEVDRMIPPEFYKAVAGIILFLARARQTGPAGDVRITSMLKQGRDYAREREKALAEGMRDVASELRLIDPADFIAFIRTEQFGNIRSARQFVDGDVLQARHHPLRSVGGGRSRVGLARRASRSTWSSTT